jgi:hypothetical protein
MGFARLGATISSKFNGSLLPFENSASSRISVPNKLARTGTPRSN